MNLAIRRILFPTDFSPAARQAQDYALALAEQFEATLYVLHAIESPALPVHGSRYSWAVPDDILPKLMEQAELKLALAFPNEGVTSIDHPIIRAIKVGHPVITIHDFAKEHQIDLIVMATHGHQGISHLLLGSVAEKMVRLSTCPVLTVRPNAQKLLSSNSSAP